MTLVGSPLTLSGGRVRDLIDGRKNQVLLPIVDVDMAQLVRDFFWVREPWRTFVSLDNAEANEVWNPLSRRGAGLMFDDGDGLSIARRVFDEENAAPRYHYGPREVARPFGRLRSASTLPRWGSRVCAKIKTVKVVFATDRNVVDLDALPYNQSAWERSPTVAVFDVSPILGNIDDLIAQGALPT